jgi:hypothetical protein
VFAVYEGADIFGKVFKNRLTCVPKFAEAGRAELWARYAWTHVVVRLKYRNIDGKPIVILISRESGDRLAANACNLDEVATGVYKYSPDRSNAICGHGMVMRTVRLRQAGASLVTELLAESNNIPFSGANTENCGLFLHSLLEKEEAEKGISEPSWEKGVKIEDVASLAGDMERLEESRAKRARETRRTQEKWFKRRQGIQAKRVADKTGEGRTRKGSRKRKNYVGDKHKNFHHV